MKILISIRDHSMPPELGTMSRRLGTWLIKQTGKGEQGVRDHFEEVMLTRQFRRGTAVRSRADIVKLSQIPSLSQLYRSGELEERPTYAIPSLRLNDIICLLREDITNLEVDM